MKIITVVFVSLNGYSPLVSEADQTSSPVRLEVFLFVVVESRGEVSGIAICT